MHSVRLVPFALKSAGIVSSIYQGLSGFFSVAVEKVSIDYHASFDANRDQYHSTELLRCLLNHFPDKRVKVLGITSLDLFIPILTFVFGEAQLDGTVAVVSSHRLRPQFYGLKPDDALMAQRAVKEAIHELGHTFGLVHCPYYECVMHSSPSVEEIDLKSEAFCPECEQAFAIKKEQPPYYPPAAANE